MLHAKVWFSDQLDDTYSDFVEEAYRVADHITGAKYLEDLSQPLIPILIDDILL